MSLSHGLKLISVYFCVEGLSSFSGLLVCVIEMAQSTREIYSIFIPAKLYLQEKNIFFNHSSPIRSI